MRVLQMNLCNSGIAGCYTGKSVLRAAELIRSRRPDIVTLNEVCLDNVATLQDAMPRPSTVVPAFRAARERSTGAAVRCTDGQPFGDAVLAANASGTAASSYGGLYPAQANNDVEERVWVCVHVPGVRYACTTHLASTSPTLAFTQCQYLLHDAIPAMQQQHGADPVVLAGDLNLEDGTLPDPRSCPPAGYVETSDHDRQHVLADAGASIAASSTISMLETTDHPALLVDLNAARSSDS